MKKVIRVTCDPDKKLQRFPLDELHPLQGKLKEMTAENFQKLRSWIIDDGFNFPFFVWRDSTNDSRYIIDGHGRQHVLSHLRDQEGFDVPKLPAVEIEAASYEEAKRKVLNASSQFNSMTNDGLYEFMIGANIPVEQLERFSLAEIDVPEFKMEFFEDPTPEAAPAEDGEKTNVSFDAYKNAAVKQVVLHYAAPEYEQIVKGLDHLLGVMGLEDYSQVVWRLVDDAIRTQK
jgi:hypothetical protein